VTLPLTAFLAKCSDALMARRVGANTFAAIALAGKNIQAIEALAFVGANVRRSGQNPKNFP